MTGTKSAAVFRGGTVEERRRAGRILRLRLLTFIGCLVVLAVAAGFSLGVWWANNAPGR